MHLKLDNGTREYAKPEGQVTMVGKKIVLMIYPYSFCFEMSSRFYSDNCDRQQSKRKR